MLQASAASVPPERTNLARYELVKVLDEGAFGKVWVGRDRDRIRRREQVVKVAVKVIEHGGEDTHLVRSEVEMHEKLFAGGGSPLLIRLLDTLFEDVQAMLVLELFESGPLSTLIDTAPQVRLPECTAAPIATALRARRSAAARAPPAGPLARTAAAASSSPLAAAAAGSDRPPPSAALLPAAAAAAAAAHALCADQIPPCVICTFQRRAAVRCSERPWEDPTKARQLAMRGRPRASTVSL